MFQLFQDVTLHEVLDDSFALQEVKCGNQKLINFLKRPSTIFELVRLTLSEPSSADSSEESKKYKYSHLASEILSADAVQLILAVLKSDSCVDLLIGFLKNNDRLNPLLASFYAKIMSLLVDNYPNEMLDFMRREATAFIPYCVKHLENASIVDFLFRLCTGVEDLDKARNIKLFLCEKKFVQSLLSIFSLPLSTDSCDNAAFLITQLIRTLRESQISFGDFYHDPLLDYLQTIDFMDNLFSKLIAASQNDCIVVNICSILSTFIQTLPDSFAFPDLTSSKCIETLPPLKFSSGDAACQGNWEVHFAKESLFNFMIDKMEFFTDYLVPTQSEQLEENQSRKLGAIKLTVVELITRLIYTPSLTVHSKLSSLDILPLLFDNFFVYPQSDLLRSKLAYIVYGIANWLLPNDSFVHSPLLDQAIRDLYAFKKILNANKVVKEAKLKRSPFKGSLYQIAYILSQAYVAGPHRDFARTLISTQSSDVWAEWLSFESNDLKEYQKLNQPDNVVADRPDTFDPTLDDESEVSRDFDRITVEKIQENLAIASNDPPSSSTVNASVERDFDFSLNTGCKNGESLFEEMCSDKINQLDGDKSTNNWFEQETTFTGASTSANTEHVFTDTTEHIQCEQISRRRMLIPYKNSSSTDSSRSSEDDVKFEPETMQDPWEEDDDHSKHNIVHDDNWANFTAALSPNAGRYVANDNVNAENSSGSQTEHSSDKNLVDESSNDIDDVKQWANFSEHFSISTSARDDNWPGYDTVQEEAHNDWASLEHNLTSKENEKKVKYTWQLQEKSNRLS
uniref:Uncharacterized protein n=1 Tax=Romanomermis culicivorax TaxID=13658 RepID=A0A915KEP4_ROMCU